MNFKQGIYYLMLLSSLGVLAQEENAVVAKEPENKIDIRALMQDYSQIKNWNTGDLSFSKEDLNKCLELYRIYLINNIDRDKNVFKGDFLLSTASYSKNNLNLSNQVFGVAAIAELAARKTNPQTREVFVNVFSSIVQCNKKNPNNGLIMPYQKDSVRTESIVPALMITSIAQMIHYQKDVFNGSSRNSFIDLAKSYLLTLESLRMEEGGWQTSLTIRGVGSKERRGFTDGVCLSAYANAVSKLGLKELTGAINIVLPELVEQYTDGHWQRNFEAQEVAEFTISGVPALAEISRLGIKDSELAGNATLALGHWLIYQYRVEYRNKTNGVFLKALCAALSVAKAKGDKTTELRFEKAIKVIAKKQMELQLGHELSEELPEAFMPYLPLAPDQIKGGGVLFLGGGSRILLHQIYWGVSGVLDYLPFNP